MNNEILHLQSPPMLNNSWLPRGDTGASKTRSTGSWTSPFAKTKAASARGMPNITWLSCGVWLSISCATRKPPRSASPLNANGLAGFTTIFSRCYKIRMQLPCCRCRSLLRSVDLPIHHILEQPIGVQQAVYSRMRSCLLLRPKYVIRLRLEPLQRGRCQCVAPSERADDLVSIVTQQQDGDGVAVTP